MRSDLLKQILETDHTYWVVSKENTANEYCRTVRKDDSILFIAIPQDVRRGLKYDEITLKQFEELKHSQMDSNIFLSPENYPPFQLYVSFFSLHDGFPVTINAKKINEFIIKSIELKSTDMYAIKALHDGLLEQEDALGKEADDE